MQKVCSWFCLVEAYTPVINVQRAPKRTLSLSRVYQIALISDVNMKYRTLLSFRDS